MNRNSMTDELQRKLDNLPDAPGVYLWKDQQGKVIYVGQAKRLRPRTKSYFAPGDHSPKNHLLREHIADIDTIVVDSEAQSLLLENNLIKEYQPRFNVRLKDDKSYPSIAVTLAEPFPQVLVTRRRDIPGARYFGPYTDVGTLRRTLGLIRRLFQVRSCTDDLPRQPRERPCLDFYIGKCRAPCVGWQDEVAYRMMIGEVIDFLKGRTTDVRSHVRRLMAKASERLDYERAAKLRDTLVWLEQVETPAAVETIGSGAADVVGYARDGNDAVCVLLRVRDGKVLSSDHRFLENVADTDDAHVLSAFMTRYYLPVDDRARRVILPFLPTGSSAFEDLISPARLLVPQRGTAARLMDLADQNARHLMESLRLESFELRRGERPRPHGRAPEPGVHRHFHQPGEGHRRIACLVRGRPAAEKRIPEVQDQGRLPTGRLRGHPRSSHPLSHTAARRRQGHAGPDDHRRRQRATQRRVASPEGTGSGVFAPGQSRQARRGSISPGKNRSAGAVSPQLIAPPAAACP